MVALKFDILYNVVIKGFIINGAENTWFLVSFVWIFVGHILHRGFGKNGICELQR